jgi:hypothetical protein
MPDRSVDRSRWLQTPCALRLGGPNRTSQPLTPSVAPWVLPRDLRSRVRAVLPSFVRRTAPHVARTPHGAARLEVTPYLSPGCLPPVRSRSCDRAKPSAFPVTFARKSSHPFARSVPIRPVKDQRPSRATPCASRFASRLPSIARRRCLSPTSAIDSRHEHPWDRSISGPAACAALTAGSFPFPKVGFFRATPDHLAAIQPRLGACLTARLQLRPVAHGSSSPFGSVWMPGIAFVAIPLWLGVVGQAQSWRSNL